MPAPQSTGRAALNDNRSSDVALDQYYTQFKVARRCWRLFKMHFGESRYLMVEPSAGTGSFFRMLPPGSVGVDVDPRYPGIITADFLTFVIPAGREAAIIGNPPFGKNASLAVRFFNRAASQASVTIIAMILPRTFRKASVQNRLSRAFHMLFEETVADDAFLFRGRPYNVPATFQIWVRRPQPRPLRQVAPTHVDFEFTTPDRADFAIQRVGARAGRIHHDFTASPNSHYFIRGKVEAVMAQLALADAAKNVAGNPSLAKSEIVALYDEWLARRAAA